jgi:hypothetical protein
MLHNLSKSNSCGGNFDKLRKILLTSLCFGANYQNFVWKKELNVFVWKSFFPKKLLGGSGPENFFLRRALPIGWAKQAHTPPAVISKFRL